MKLIMILNFFCLFKFSSKNYVKYNQSLEVSRAKLRKTDDKEMCVWNKSAPVAPAAAERQRARRACRV